MFTYKELSRLGYEKLKMRFENKIDHDLYYLSYSGGRDSHLVMWFIKQMGYEIPIVGVNTYREHKEIRRRIYKHSDHVLYPLMSFEEINEKYGMPCFTKNQDEYIDRYQKGSRAKSTMDKINRTGSGSGKFGLNKKASTLTLSGQLHRVSKQCCVYTKEKPMEIWGEENNRKAIVCIRSSESVTREKVKSCMNDSGKFNPSFDLTDNIVHAMEKEFSIPVPEVYNYVCRTGCIGCPYGRNIERELAIVSKNQRDYAIKSFKESYDVKGVDYKNIQLIL